MRIGVKSDTGMVREQNEDSYNIIAGYTGVPVTFILADGMGGHNSGEIASKMAVDFVSNYILQYPGYFTNEEENLEAIQNVIEKANLEVYNAASGQGTNSGMGTTLITAVAFNKKLLIGHVGDSRVYLIREGKIEQITTDHSYIEELLKNGSITREEAENHPNRNIITRALGCSDSIQVDTYTCYIKDDDIFILCTDGLSNMLHDEEIKEIVEAVDDPELACRELVSEANRRGGDDNITVIVFKNG